MSNKKLAILAITAVIMVIWAVVQSTTSGPGLTKNDAPKYLVQGLNPSQVAEIVVATGKTTVVLKKQNEQFVVVNKDHYPADIIEINRLISSCMDFKTSELYADDKANHKDLGVTEEDAANVIKFLKDDGSILTGLVIGKERGQGQGRYIRLMGDDRVYVSMDYPWISQEPIRYIDRKLVAVNYQDIESVTVTGPDESYKLLSADVNNSKVVLENMPEDKNLKESEAKKVFSVLTNIDFDDVSGKTAESDLDFDRQFVCRLKNSTIYTVNIATKNDKTFITCDCEFMDKAQVVKAIAIETPKELKAKEAKLVARDKAKLFSNRHKGWLYQIPDYKAQQLVREREDLLEDKPDEPVESDIEPVEPVETPT